jgi:very-short-patch-repair endonuclease
MASVFARTLRQTMTPHEVKLWRYLRSLKKERGWHFRRQAPLEGYIVDFVCYPARLVIEADGGQHNEEGHRADDATRDAHLEREGFTVLRFWNGDIDQNIDGVMRTIHDALRAAELRTGRNIR